ncbi:MAG: HAD-IA family hydrolase [Acidobacteria bacterium]|nr:HAD-IA family hydrolase [Acidobacteriota bacterium]
MPRPLIVFDLDGTLVNSRRDLAQSTNVLLETYGASRLDEPVIGRMVGEGVGMLLKRAFTAARFESVPTDAMQRFLEIYDGRLLNHTRPYPGIPEALQSLQSHARLAVLTNKPLGAAARILDRLGLASPFADVVGGDGPHPRKPDPGGLLWLIKRAGTDRVRAVLVGDSGIDLATARNAGVRVCLATYGFGWEEGLRGRLGPADLTVDRGADLAAVLDIS